MTQKTQRKNKSFLNIEKKRQKYMRGGCEIIEKELAIETFFSRVVVRERKRERDSKRVKE